MMFKDIFVFLGGGFLGVSMFVVAPSGFCFLVRLFLIALILSCLFKTPVNILLKFLVGKAWTKVPFGEYVLFFLEFLSKSKIVFSLKNDSKCSPARV